jgi:hypothetical protein
MILGALLLFFPVPQTVDTAKVVNNSPAAISERATKENSDSTAPAASTAPASTLVASAAPATILGDLPAAPDPKVKSDAELAAEPAAMPFQPVKPAARKPYETPRQKKIWYALAAAGGAGAGFDAWSTRRAISGGFGTETNPFLRPFAHSNALYAATQVSPLVMDFLGKKFMTSQHPLLRRVWWLPQAAGASFSFAAGAHNVGVVH